MSAPEQSPPATPDPIPDRTAGLLVGLALADRWAEATEVALCVADAVATGLPLDDERAVDLLRRNLRDRHATSYTDASAPISADATLAASAVFAAAHHRDDGVEWDDALHAMLDVLEVSPEARDGLSAWANSIADLIETGGFDSIRLLQQSAWATPLHAIAQVVAGEGEPLSDQERAVRFLRTESAAMQVVPAATGAFVGALLGAGALPAGPIAELRGWPEADADALMRIAADVAAPRERGLPGVRLPYGTPNPDREPVLPEGGGGLTWRVARVALTANDTEERR